MTGDAADTNAEQLDTLSTDELRRRAFAKAEHSHDVGFFWDLVKHLRASEALAREDASLGGISGGITEAVEAVHELLSGHLDADDDLLRARFIDYLSARDG